MVYKRVMGVKPTLQVSFHVVLPWTALDGVGRRWASLLFSGLLRIILSFLVFQDLVEAQPSLGRGLQQLLDFDGDVEATFSRTFQISYEV